MDLFKKQRTRYQSWLNGFVESHHDSWWMPLFTVALGLGYACYGIVLLTILGSIIWGLAIAGDLGIWITCIGATIAVLYYIGMIARVPGDNAWERKQKEKN